MRVPKRYRDHYRRPWTRKAKYSPGFRRWLSKQGLLTPHFSYKEAACKDGTPVPRYLRYRARNHAFNLERLRQKLGGRPIVVLSWYRHRRYNRSVGGASRSQHIKACATDHSKEWVESIGRERVLRAARETFGRRGGIGTYSAGSVHFDSRGWFARW